MRPRVTYAIRRLGAGQYLTFDYLKEGSTVEHETPLEITSEADAHVAHHLLGLGIRRHVLRDGLKAGFNWSQILALLLKFGLPLLEQLIASILNGTKTREEVLATLNS